MLKDHKIYAFILEPSDPTREGIHVPGKFLRDACYMFYPDKEGKIWSVYRVLRENGVCHQFLADFINLRRSRFITEEPPVIGYDRERKRYILSIRLRDSGKIKDIFALQKLTPSEL